MTFYDPTDNEIHEEVSKLAEEIYINQSHAELDNWLQAEIEFWICISSHQKLSESFIEKYHDKVNWHNISQYQKLSESFIEKHKDKVDWFHISQYQKLSESFIDKHYDKVNWIRISEYQKLSEPFIDKHYDKVNWFYISIYQKLSESFIEKHHDKVYWPSISVYQKLSEFFIEQYHHKVNWFYISAYQKFSENFIQKHNIKMPFNNWLYTSKEEKLNYIKKNTNYKIINDEYILAYKSTRYNGYSVFNFQYQYEVGKTYESHCDCNLFNEDSFGLSAWTKAGALEYYKQGELYLVKIVIENIGTIIHSSKKIRCFKLEVLEKIS